MTIRGVGNPVPSQLYLMQLAGLVVAGFCQVEDPTESQIAASREQAYQNLRRMTGQDFGYDVQRWYEFLIVGDYGLTHPYGYGTLRSFLLSAGFVAPYKKDVIARSKASKV